MVIMTMITVTGEMMIVVDIVIPIGYGINGAVDGNGSRGAGGSEKLCTRATSAVNGSSEDHLRVEITKKETALNSSALLLAEPDHCC